MEFKLYYENNDDDIVLVLFLIFHRMHTEIATIQFVISKMYYVKGN